MHLKNRAVPIDVPGPQGTTANPKNRALAIQTSGRDRTALTLLAAMFLAAAVVTGASLSAAGSGVFHKISQALDSGHVAAIEAEQLRQAAILADLGKSVRAVSADVGTLSTRLAAAEHDGATASDRFALVDTDIAGMAAEVRALRATRSEGSLLWVAPVSQLDTAVAAARTDAAAARGDTLALRSSFDARDQAYRQDIGAINKRIDRIEQLVARDLTGSIRSQTHRRQVRRKPRPVVVARPKAEAGWWGEAAAPDVIRVPAAPQ